MGRASALGGMLQWFGVITGGISKKKITKKKHLRNSKAESHPSEEVLDSWGCQYCEHKG